MHVTVPSSYFLYILFFSGLFTDAIFMSLHVDKAPLGPKPFFQHPMGMDERPTSDFATALLVNLTLNPLKWSETARPYIRLRLSASVLC